MESLKRRKSWLFQYTIYEFIPATENAVPGTVASMGAAPTGEVARAWGGPPGFTIPGSTLSMPRAGAGWSPCMLDSKSTFGYLAIYSVLMPAGYDFVLALIKIVKYPLDSLSMPLALFLSGPLRNSLECLWPGIVSHFSCHLCSMKTSICPVWVACEIV